MNDQFSETELRKLDLNLLLVFAALMRERSVARAARRLYLGSSAVSMALARLRDAIGDDLFVRASGSMEATPHAVALWAEVAPALSRIEAAVRGIGSFDPATSDAVFRFGAPDDLEFVLIPLLLQRLSSEAPGIRLIVRPSDFRTLLDHLDSGDTDLALSATPDRGVETRHRVHPLHRERFAVLFDPAQVRVRVPISLSDYLTIPHLLLSPSGHLRGLIDEQLSAMGYERRVMAALTHFPTMPFVLKGQSSLVNMPATAARYYANTYGLALSPLPVASPEFEVSLTWHVRTGRDSAHIWFRELVTAAVEEVWRGAQNRGEA